MTFTVKKTSESNYFALNKVNELILMTIGDKIRIDMIMKDFKLINKKNQFDWELKSKNKQKTKKQ